MLQPPSCQWTATVKTGRYAAFISHFKVEAGSDARYLKDLLERMLGARVYLDSVDLVDLETLVDGVHLSDCVVLLGAGGEEQFDVDRHRAVGGARRRVVCAGGPLVHRPPVARGRLMMVNYTE